MGTYGLPLRRSTPACPSQWRYWGWASNGLTLSNYLRAWTGTSELLGGLCLEYWVAEIPGTQTGMATSVQSVGAGDCVAGLGRPCWLLKAGGVAPDSVWVASLGGLRGSGLVLEWAGPGSLLGDSALTSPQPPAGQRVYGPQASLGDLRKHDQPASVPDIDHWQCSCRNGQMLICVPPCQSRW